MKKILTAKQAAFVHIKGLCTYKQIYLIFKKKSVISNSIIKEKE